MLVSLSVTKAHSLGLDNRTRLISLAAQKFVSDIADEANWYTSQRQQIGIKAKQEQGFDARVCIQ